MNDDRLMCNLPGFEYSRMKLQSIKLWVRNRANFIPPKRRFSKDEQNGFWKTGQTFQSAFSKHFSRV